MVEVEDLKKYFPVERSFIERILSRKRRYVKAVDGITFAIRRGEVFALAGESGCGKTTTAYLIVRLLEPTSGRIVFNGRDITHEPERSLRRWYRRRVQIIFQDPYASLNPRMKVGEAIAHPLEIHGIAEGKEKKEMVLDMLRKVGLTPPELFYNKYPHELSGGQRQRVAIARALILRPELVVADEPTSALDVSIRSQILKLLLELKKELNLTYLYITHDLATAYYIADRIAVMYLGKIVELGSVEDVLENPLHPYTKALLSAIPIPDPRMSRTRRRVKIPGEPPNPINPPTGCRFHPRCPWATKLCAVEEPELREVSPGHYVACHMLK
ncbi:MAG: oligopeptide ABC transporter ATP-binding protein [Thermoprotei archaeon]|nr:MAG: oligopeptide ABC transporter ATP-binding protein [Thermoprotei archaeon]RLF22894.1 MAG: oligopeptide ABC transporter ATP-binding protein [Thermoprotei archaeon]